MFQSFTLKNGIKIISEPMQNRRTVAMGVYVKVGSQDENLRNNGISHLIEHMLFKGTDKHSAKELADITARMGDDINAFTSKECTAVYGMSISENLEEMVSLFADMLVHSTFDAKELAKEKHVVMDEIDMYTDSADDLVHELLQKKIWNEDALGFFISGTKSTVKSFSRAEVTRFHSRFYRPDNMLISVAGGYEEDKLLKWLEREFGAKNMPGEIADRVYQVMGDRLGHGPYHRQYADRSQNRSSEAEKNSLAIAPKYHRCFVTADKEIEQLHINLAFPALCVADERRFVYSLFNSVFGGSNNSRLFQKIREEEGMAYSIYSYSSAYERAGLFHIDITVQPTLAACVLEKVFEEVRRFLRDGVEDAELSMCKQQIRTEMIMSAESPKTRMESNAKYAMAGGALYSTEEKLKRIDCVCKEDITALARDILKLSQCSMCVVGNKANYSVQELKKIWNTLEKEASQI